jgi:hypothetical protein
VADFKTVPLRPMTGIFDSLSSADEIGYGNFRLVKNATTRTTRNRQRGGGWRRLFADDSPYNNQDLHDQLTDRLSYYDSYTGHAMGGGDLAGYNYPYFAPSYVTAAYSVFPAATGPYCPVYLGNFPSGLYNGCPIFYPFVGYPYQFVPGFVNTTGARAHWRFDTISATTPDLFGGLDLTNFGPTVEAGLIGNALKFSTGQWIDNVNAAFQTGDIYFGFTGWVKRNTSGSASEPLLDKWGAAASRQYRVRIVSGQIVFEVSSDGTNTVSVTHPFVLNSGEWALVSVWHDPVLNTINVKVNDETKASTSHSTGVFSTLSNFAFGINNETLSATLNSSLDAWTFWKNRFPSENELLAIYNAAAGIGYPFDSGACDTGLPFYYQYSFLYTSCPVSYGNDMVHGYPYGARTPVYDPQFSYDYVYCGRSLHRRDGCREAVTMLNEIVTESSRKLIASTMSRVYELNQSSGNWRILADGLGNSGYTVDQCTCNRVRGVSDTMGGYFLYTNNFDQPMSYFVGTEASNCSLSSLEVITDLDALGINRAGGVVVWKGFAIWFDLTENGTRFGGDVIWSDQEDPLSYIESDTSFAGRSTIAVGETILAAAELGNWLILYTDKSIIRVTLVGGEDVFNFERIYTGGNALKYKFSLVNGGDFHFYLGESDAYIFTQFDTRPINVAWVTKAAGLIFNGISEDDAAYEPINKDACDLVTGGWSDEKREVWLSWPTGENICPDVTLRFNFKFNAADLVDHGFTSFITFRQDERPTVGQWIEDMGICPRGSKVATGLKDGSVCTGSSTVVANPPLYIRNPTEDPDLPIHDQSLCARLAGMSMDDFCQDCPSKSTFITASADDFTLKQQEDDIYYREMLGGNIEDYDGYSCHGEFYHFLGYDTVIQEGSEGYRSGDEKMIKRVIVEAEPLPQSSPSPIECDVAYGSQPTCMTWVAARSLDFECQTEKTAAQHLADKTRQDDGFNFPVWRRGIYISTRFRITGIGGGGTFSALNKIIMGWGQADSP